MYKGFQEATYLPCDVHVETIDVRGDSHAKNGRKVPAVSTSAAKKADGSIIMSLANVCLDKAQTLNVNLEGMQAKAVSGRILTCKNITDYNDFDNTQVVVPTDFKDAKLKKNVLTVKIPAKSIVVLDIK